MNNTNNSANPDYGAISKEDINTIDDTIKSLGIDKFFNTSFAKFVEDKLKKENA